MMSDIGQRRVLWLTPDKPENISVGRQRIADELSLCGFNVTVRGTNLRTGTRSLRERGEYDAIIGTTRAGAVAATVVGKLGGVPVVVDHVDPIRQLYETQSRWLPWLVERLENVSFRLAAQVLYVYDEEEERIRQLTDAYSQTDLGVDYDRFSNPDESARRTASDHLETLDLDENISIYVGGLEEVYNVRPLLEAMDHLPNWSLLIVGTGSLEPVVEQYATGRDDIEYIGVVPHETIPGYLHQADVGVSLVDDPHTLKILEYLAASVPAVQLDGRARARFGDHVTYCSLDPSDIAHAIHTAGENSVSDATHDFVRRVSWSTIAEQYESVLRRVITETA